MDSDTTFSLVPLEDDAPSTPSPPSRSTSATRGSSVSNTAAEASTCLLRSTPTTLEQFAPLSPRTTHASLAFPVPHIEDDSDATASCSLSLSSTPSSPSPSSSSRPSSPSAQRTRTRRRGSDSSDSEPNGPPVYFGTPSSAEHARRRKVSAKMRERRLLRRDSLDLARRRSVGPVMPSSDEPQGSNEGSDTANSTGEVEGGKLDEAQPSSEMDSSNTQAEEVHSDTLGNEDEDTLEADQDVTQDCTMVLLAGEDQGGEREDVEEEEGETVAEVQPEETEDELEPEEAVQNTAETAAEAVSAELNEPPEPLPAGDEEERALEAQDVQAADQLVLDASAQVVEEVAEETGEAAEPSEAAEEQPVETAEATLPDSIEAVEVDAVTTEASLPEEQASAECEVQVQAPSSPTGAPTSPASSQPPPPASPHTPTRQRQILAPQSCAISALEGHSFEALSPGVALAAHGSAARGDSSLLIDALRHESYDDSLQPDSPFAMHAGLMLEMEQPLYGKSPARELGGGGGGTSPLKRRRSARLSMRQELLAQQQAQQTPSTATKEQASPSKPWFSLSKTGTASPATVTEALSAWATSTITSPKKAHQLPPLSLPDWATGDASPRKPMRALERARALAAASPTKAAAPLLFVDAAAERARADALLRLAASTPLPPASPEKPQPAQLTPAPSAATDHAPQPGASGPSARLFENLKASKLAAAQASEAAAAPACPVSAASSVPEAQPEKQATPAPGSALKAPSTTSRLPGTSSVRPGTSGAARPGVAGSSAAVKSALKVAPGIKAPAATVSRLPKPASGPSGIARPAAVSALRKPVATAARAPAPAAAAKAPTTVRTVAPAPRVAPAAAAPVRKAAEAARPVPERKPVAARPAVAARAPAASTAAAARPAVAPRIRAAGAASRPPLSAPAATAVSRQASSSPTRALPAVRLRTAAPPAPSPAQSATRVPAAGVARVPFVRGAARTANNVPASRMWDSPARPERVAPAMSAPSTSPEKRAAIFAAPSAPAPAPAVAAPPAPQVPSVYGSQAPPGRARRVPAASEAAIKTPPASIAAPASVPVPATAPLAPPVVPAPASAPAAAPRHAFPTAAPLEPERAPGRAMRGPFTSTQPAASAAVVVQPDMLVSPMKAARRARASDEAAPPSSDSAQSVEGATVLAGKALRPRVAPRTAQTITSQRIFSGESKPEVEEPVQPSTATGPASRRPARAAAARAPAPVSVLKATSKESSTDLPLSHAELVRLTNQHTRRNEAYLAKLDVVTIRIEGPRPPSPTSKVRKVAGARLNKGEAAQARERRARDRASLELDMDDDSDGELPPMDAVDVEKHTLGAGEEELFATPPRVGAAAGGRKSVKWHKALFVGPSEASAEHMAESDHGIPAKAIRSRYGAPRSSLAAKEIPLDRNGNITVEAPLSPRMRRTKVTIRKYVYDDDC